METLLTVITVISVATAIFAFASARRIQQREEKRSNARVQALSNAASEGFDLAPSIREHHRSERVQLKEEGGLWLSEAPVETASETLFGTVQRQPESGARWPIAAAAGLIALLGSSLIFLNSSEDPGAAPATAQHAPVTATPLELVALSHSRETSSLTIAGTVRNPAAGLRLEGLTAVVSLLDRDGSLISTKDVPLDYRALAPGEEAPFKVSVPDRGSIARYRVSFRAGSDVVPHVDRRASSKLARAFEITTSLQ